MALTRWTFFGKMCFLFNILSRFVIAFLPRGECLNFITAVNICTDFGAPKIKPVTTCTFSPFIFHEVMGLDAMQANQDGQVILKGSDKTWPTEGASSKQFQYSCCENPMNMNSMKKQKDVTLEDEPLQS